MQQDLAQALAQKDFVQCKDLQQQVEKARKLDAQADELPKELDAALQMNDFAKCEAVQQKINGVNAKIDGIVTTGTHRVHYTSTQYTQSTLYAVNTHTHTPCTIHHPPFFHSPTRSPNSPRSTTRSSRESVDG
jgi:hypothetical protein